MPTYQASIQINATSFVGTALVGYQVDSSGLTWDIGGGTDWSISSKGGGVSTIITAEHLCQASIHILAKSSFISAAIKTQISAIAQNYAPEDVLTISMDGEGDWFATLSSTFWSDLGQTSVYPGFRIMCGDGLAVITEDPQYHVRTVGINIISQFASWKMQPGQWNLRIPLGTDFNRSVVSPNYFRKSDLLSVYFQDMRELVVSESQYLTHRAGDLRRWNKIPADFLDQLLATLGCYLRLDMLDSEGRRRLAYEWIRFLLYAETEYFADFLGYIYDTHFGVEALWTDDYRSFVSYSPDMDDSFYPTNHVALTYNPDDWDMNDYDQWSLVVGTFYKLASVPLVLQALSAKRKDATTAYLVVADQSLHDYVSWSPFLVIASTTLYMTMVDHRRIYRESHSPPLQLNYATLYVVMVDHRHREWSDYSPLLVLP